jgi:hypothetical protein
MNGIDIKTGVERSREIALYAQLSAHTWFCVFEVTYSDYDEHRTKLPDGERRERPMEGFVRVSEPIRVEFTAINDDAIVQNAVESLDAEERKAIEDLNAKIASIRERKAQLLTLTHQ